jgi:pimeloyl-ACP methyl ester carboxylesterase
MQRHELVRPDGPIRYRVGGRDEGPILVLLHGAPLDHRSWDAQREALEPRYRIAVPDLRAHGESTTSDPFSFAAAVDDVVALLDDLDLHRIGLIGLSLGGNIAQEIVHRDPARVAALVVADATCNTSARHAWQAPMAIAALGRVHDGPAGPPRQQPGQPRGLQRRLDLVPRPGPRARRSPLRRPDRGLAARRST